MSAGVEMSLERVTLGTVVAVVDCVVSPGVILLRSEECSCHVSFSSYSTSTDNNYATGKLAFDMAHRYNNRDGHKNALQHLAVAGCVGSSG